MVFDSHSDYVYAAASNRANVKPSNAKACGAVLMHDPYELHVDRLVMDPATGQLSIFMPH
jgi:hypothetical protein